MDSFEFPDDVKTELTRLFRDHDEEPSEEVLSELETVTGTALWAKKDFSGETKAHLRKILKHMQMMREDLSNLSAETGGVLAAHVFSHPKDPDLIALTLCCQRLDGLLKRSTGRGHPGKEARLALAANICGVFMRRRLHVSDAPSSLLGPVVNALLGCVGDPPPQSDKKFKQFLKRAIDKTQYSKSDTVHVEQPEWNPTLLRLTAPAEEVDAELEKVRSQSRRDVMFLPLLTGKGRYFEAMCFKGSTPVVSVVEPFPIGEVAVDSATGGKRTKEWRRRVADSVGDAVGPKPLSSDRSFIVSIIFGFSGKRRGHQGLAMYSFLGATLEGVAAGLFGARDAKPKRQKLDGLEYYAPGRLRPRLVRRPFQGGRGLERLYVQRLRNVATEAEEQAMIIVDMV